MRDLGAEDPSRADASKSRLIAIGPRAVRVLIESLDGDRDRVRCNAIAVLSLIRDPRAREPIIAQLIDRSWRIREASARALSRFPCPECVTPLERVLRTDSRVEVRLAALQSLIALFEAGFDESIHDVIAQFFETRRDCPLRRAALAVVPLLRGRERRALLKKLREDADEEIARSARALAEGADRQTAPDEMEVRAFVRALGSRRPAVWNEALTRLTVFGPDVIDPLVSQMRRRCHDAEYCARAGMVLRGLGSRRLRPIAAYLKTVDEPLPLEIIVEVVGGLQDKPLIYRLKDLIERLNARAISKADGTLVDALSRVRAKAHLQLARIGSRVAIDDLKNWLSAPGRRIEEELLAATALIGTRDELSDLIRAYRKEDRWMRPRIREVFLGVMRRERIRRNNRMFASFPASDRRALARIFDTPDAPATRRAARSLPARRRRSRRVSRRVR